jgi:hypothetical protein
VISKDAVGVVAAVISSALGGTAAALTRYTIHASDPVTLAALRFGIGVVSRSSARFFSRSSSSSTTSR